MIADIVLTYVEGRGGLEEVINIVSNGLIRKGHRIRIFIAYESKYLEWKNDIKEIYIYKLDGDLNVNNLAYGYKKIINEIGNPDIIIATHTPVMSLICNLAIRELKGNKPPIISWIHGEPKFYGSEELLNYSDAHIAISNDIGRQINKYITKASPIYYIPNPIDIKSFHKVKQNKKDLELIYIGRLKNREKRIDVLFNALKKLDRPWKLKVIGSGKDEVELKLLSKRLNIENNIAWYGWLDEPWSNIETASLLVLTSDVEGFGLVLVEALGRGIPVISSDCSGPKDIIKNDINGWIFERNNSEQLYNILSELQSGKKLLPKSEICIKSVEKFETEQVIHKFEALLLKYTEKEKNILDSIENLIAENEIEEALDTIEYYYDRFCSNTRFLNMKSIIAIKMYEYEIAISNLEYAKSLLNEVDLDTYYNLAYAYYKNREWRKSLNTYMYILDIVDIEEQSKILNIIDEIYKQLWY